MSFKLRYSQYNERSILIEWPASIDESILKDVLYFKGIIEKKYVKQKVYIISAYNSLLIIYGSTIDNVNGEFEALKSLYVSLKETYETDSNIFKIPVCYEDEFAIDLASYSKKIKRPKDHIIRLHSEPIYTVFFIGFLPGFLYLGGLNSDLHLDRKTTPNLNVKKGSVGIGGKQTGIYPQDSPGGWHIIGNSPLELFNPKQNPPCFLKAGDKVKFHPISKSEYAMFQEQIKHSNFDLKTLLIDD
ncbi:5-oxoprolinase subunit PxpB [Winogradskyella sp. SM1960]|uniref:5-oxoprolinase subunit PxpB n=1 Tax=Winogradskyella sp. SM1960 TaxID=2865955 RepID=UPI001CD20E23|nr:5-oxoprolinase subunit PxpB [Winogradskyella sp. SM1960]